MFPLEIVSLVLPIAASVLRHVKKCGLQMPRVSTVRSLSLNELLH